MGARLHFNHSLIMNPTSLSTRTLTAQIAAIEASPGSYLVANGGAEPSVNAHVTFLDQSVPARAPYWGIGHDDEVMAAIVKLLTPADAQPVS